MQGEPWELLFPWKEGGLSAEDDLHGVWLELEPLFSLWKVKGWLECGQRFPAATLSGGPPAVLDLEVSHPLLDQASLTAAGMRTESTSSRA